eukprot:TRINITY_DN6442_c0_g1_i6.p4 TRINITY_DN6442_c0_g1~~TRINITY_DN6442_c0_g1_i6.p4  ORF type:complete len:110 (-),score=29.34 TRINITY_DN6442_c0_g1_i6:220-549(-)
MAEIGEENSVKDREGQEQVKDLDKITDVVDEKELDANKVKKAMTELAEAQKATKEAQRKRQRELAAVKIKKADAELIAQEFELDIKTAELRLREAGGDARIAIKSLIDQ